MSPRLDSVTLDRALAALLDRAGAVLCAMTDGCLRTELPDDPRFAGFMTLPDPDATFVDVVVPADRMAVVAAWENAVAGGVGQALVHAAADPGRTLLLTFVDARHTCGTWIGTLADDDAPAAEHAAAPDSFLDAAALVATRPRTATVGKNMYGIMVDADDRVSGMLGWTRDELVGRRSLEFIHADDHDRAIGQWLEMRARQAAQRVRVRHLHRDGHWVWVEVANTYVGDGDPEGLMVTSELVDISDEMAAHEAVRQQEKLFRRLAESLPVGVFQVAGDRAVVYANARLATIFGVRAATTLAEQLAAVADGDRERLTAAFDDALDAGEDQEVEVEVRLPVGGERRRCLVTVGALSGSEGAPGAIVSVTDITEGARLREELRLRATYDALTGCHNRASAMAHLEHALAADAGRGTAVIFVDLDGFKPINDTYGHAVGDDVLVEAAHRISALLRDDDVVGRIGGDEFLVVCRGVEDAGRARALARRVAEHLSGPVVAGYVDVELRASVGVTLSAPGTDADRLVAEADAAMYESKRTSTGEAVLYRPPSPAASGF
jgi:diguanylate cyclase (GGDEF)-like protein/PAS domain S-box-containing protein